MFRLRTYGMEPDKHDARIQETVEAQQIKPSASFDIQLRFKVQPPCSYQNFVV